LSLYLIPASGGAKRKIGYLHEGLNALGHPFCWTPDSKTLVKETVLDGTTSLVALSIKTGIEHREITRPRPGGRDTDPSVSPDGRTLAFMREAGPGMHDIHLVALDRDLAPQGEPRRLTAESDYLANPLWLGDSSELLYTAGHQGARGVWRVGARIGAAPRQVAALAQPGLQVALSRNGLLAYARPFTDYDIWRAHLEEGAPPNPAPLIASTFVDAEPKYSPDGKMIAFHSNRSGRTEIWVSNSNGLGAVQLTSLHAQSGSPAWSPDSSRIAFDSQSGHVVDIYVVEVANRKLRRLTSDPGIHITPSWSRDGKWIYFASEKTGRLEVWKMASVGGAAVQVTREGGFVAEESGDGRFLFYSKNGQDPTTLWRKSLETGAEEQVVDALRYWFYFAVADDGIYFIPSRDSKAMADSFTIAFYELSTGRIRTVVGVDKSPGVGFSIAPDRKSFLFAPSEDHGGDLMLVENFR
jgi:Tol biopolymer transport system component